MRFSKKVFIDLLVKMLGFGTAVGLIFPFFSLLFGVRREIALSPLFFISCIFAGIMVGLISFLISRLIIRKRLINLVEKINKVEESISLYHSEEFTGSLKVDEYKIAEDSSDCFGKMASAFNELVKTLLDTMQFQKAYKQYIEDLSENLDLEQLSDFALKILMEFSGSTAGILFVEKDGDLTVASSNGIKEATSLGKNQIVLDVLKSGKRRLIDFPEGIRLDGVLTEYLPSQLVIEPIVYNSINMGILVLASSHKIRKDFLDELDIFTKSLSVILNNALQHERMQKLAAIDPLTGIFNRRFGLNRLSEECSRAIRFKTPLGVIMFDIDKFKLVNDTYGHIAGDRIIKRMVTEAKQVLRNGDVLVRYGGEEFLVILPGANKENCHRVAERIRYAVGQSVTTYGENEIKVTVSLGVDSYPESPAQEPVELIDNADKALYTAKKSGRNKTVVN